MSTRGDVVLGVMWAWSALAAWLVLIISIASGEWNPMALSAAIAWTILTLEQWSL